MATNTNNLAVNVREATLPGVGKKYVVSLETEDNLAIIVKSDGERQIYHFLEGDDRPHDMFKLNAEESQQVANLLGKAMVGAPELDKLELALGALELEWIELEEDAALVGKTLQNFPLRSKTGASIVAIMRGEQAIPNPDITTTFEVGDTVMVIGSHEQTKAARAAILG